MSKNNAVSLEAQDNFRDPPAEMAETLQVLLGPEAQGFSASCVSRPAAQWNAEMEQWRRSDLSDRRWAYIWVDGIYCGLRAEDVKLCALLAVEDGVRESADSWRESLPDLKGRGMSAPKLAVGDGALGFWAALDQAYPDTRHRRCWFHKTGNILNVLPKSVQPRAKRALQQIWMADTRNDAEAAFKSFADTYGEKYPKAAEKLPEDRDELMALCDFPAAHWQSIRTTNPIESTFATIRHRTRCSRGCLSRRRMLCMLSELGLCAERRWRRLSGFRKLGKVVAGMQFFRRNRGGKTERPDGRLNAARPPSTTFGNISTIRRGRCWRSPSSMDRMLALRLCRANLCRDEYWDNAARQMG